MSSTAWRTLQSVRTAFAKAGEQARRQADLRRTLHRTQQSYGHPRGPAWFARQAFSSAAGRNAQQTGGYLFRQRRTRGILDFEPQLRIERKCIHKPHPKCKPRMHNAMPCPGGRSMKMTLLEAHIANHSQWHSQNCPKRLANQGRYCPQRTSTSVADAVSKEETAGRRNYEQMKEQARMRMFRYRSSARYRYRAQRRSAHGLIPGRMAITSRYLQHSSGRLAGQASAPVAQNVIAPHQYAVEAHSSPHYSHPYTYNPGLRSQIFRSGPFYAPAFLAQRSLPYLSSPRQLSLTSQSAAGFHTTSRRRNPNVLVAAHAIINLLKSASALSYINLLFRISVSLIPISLKRAHWLRRARLAQLAAGAVVAQSSWPQTLLKYFLRGSLALPFVLLGAVLLASLERTPITGRWRLILLNSQEEKEIITKVLDAGEVTRASSTTADNAVATRDWVSIMRAVLGEEAAAPNTLLGGRVLDREIDWRVQFVETVLSKIEAGVRLLGNDSSVEPVAGLQAPPVRIVLGSSNRSRNTDQHNAVLVVERPEANAFSFGFYGATDAPEPGVIIVFTGAIDQIMQTGQQEKAALADYHHIPTTDKHSDHASQVEPNWLLAFFQGIVPASRPQPPKKGTPPQIVVTKEQEDALAVLLSHELSHLVLSHTIESYASTTLLWPQLEKLGWDSESSFQQGDIVY